jgi:hypothetical protein
VAYRAQNLCGCGVWPQSLTPSIAHLFHYFEDAGRPRSLEARHRCKMQTIAANPLMRSFNNHTMQPNCPKRLLVGLISAKWSKASSIDAEPPTSHSSHVIAAVAAITITCSWVLILGRTVLTRCLSVQPQRDRSSVAQKAPLCLLQLQCVIL